MYGTKKATKGINKGAQGQDLKDKVTINAEKVETKIEGSKETDVKELIEKDPESKKAYNEISQEVNKKEDEAKEEEARKEIPNSTTEVVETVNNGEKINIGITKDENTGKNENTVKEDKKEEPVKELVSENGTKTTIDVNNVKDVPAEETKAPVVETKEENKKAEDTTNGIASMFPEEAEEDSAKEFSKQELNDKKTEETPVVETEVTKEVLPIVESTEKEEATIVETKKEEKAVEETKSAPKAELVEVAKEVKPVAEEKVEEKVEKTTFVNTCISVQRTENATFKVTKGKILSVQADDEQISVSNTESTITVVNNFKEFDGTISLRAITPDGTVDLVVIFK